MSRAIAVVAGCAAFAVLATANSGGYRYGISDQAFYQPAVVQAMHPERFPRDRALLDVQSHLMWSDEALATIAHATGIGLPALFAVVYAGGLALLFGAGMAFARAAGCSWWATAALLTLLTFRHRIARTGANSLEGYMHTRMVAFAIGVAALAALLRGRPWWSIAAIGLAGVVHPTTAVWFGFVWVVAVGAGGQERRRRPMGGFALAGAAVIALAAAVALADRLVIMDPAWLAVLADKDYLFPTEWPLYAWAANLLYPVAILAIHRERRRAGAAVAGEEAVVIGLISLVAVFLVSVPLTAARLALAVQLQVTRVFWLLDFAAAAFVAWWLVDRLARSPGVRAAIVGVLIAASIGRGTFLLSHDRRLATLDLPASPWTDVLRWLRAQPGDWHVLADPAHGWLFGTSVRVGAEKDTLVEAGKDTALAMYDRALAMQVAERLAATAGYEDLSDEALRRLAADYDLDVAVVRASRSSHLPALYRNGAFAVLDLR